MTTLNCFSSLCFTWLGLLYYQTWPSPLESVRIEALLFSHASSAHVLRFIPYLGTCLGIGIYPTPLAPLVSFRSSKVGNEGKLSVRPLRRATTYSSIKGNRIEFRAPSLHLVAHTSSPFGSSIPTFHPDPPCVCSCEHH